jgi:hypothetical protein
MHPDQLARAPFPPGNAEAFLQAIGILAAATGTLIQVTAQEGRRQAGRGAVDR